MTKTYDIEESEQVLQQVCDVVAESLGMQAGMVEPVHVVELLTGHLARIKKAKDYKPMRCTHGILAQHWYERFLLMSQAGDCQNAEVSESEIATLKAELEVLYRAADMNSKSLHDAMLIADGWRARADDVRDKHRELNKLHEQLLELLPEGDAKSKLVREQAIKGLAAYSKAADSIAMLLKLNPEPSRAVTPEENVTPAAAAAPAGDAQVYSNPMVDALNDAFARDPVALAVLISNFVPCNADFAENSAMICQDVEVVSTNVRNGAISAMGLLNGCLQAAAMPKIATKWSEPDAHGIRKMLGFCIYDGD